MSRYFTLMEADRMLPEVERLLRAAIAAKMELAESEGAIQKAVQRIVMLGGSTGNRDQIAAERSRRDSTAERLKAAIGQIEELGIQVKDLDIGLIDFPTLYHGNEVLLCWRLGEERISFWHGLEEGFRGRKPLDAEFLQNHRGDSVC
jgi:hypothetical protein